VGPTGDRFYRNRHYRKTSLRVAAAIAAITSITAFTKFQADLPPISSRFRLME